MICFLQFTAHEFILKSYLCIADKFVGRARGQWKKSSSRYCRNFLLYSLTFPAHLWNHSIIIQWMGSCGDTQLCEYAKNP